MHAHTHAHTHTLHPGTCTRTRTHTSTLSSIQVRAHAHTPHTSIQVRAHTHTHTHTHHPSRYVHTPTPSHTTLAHFLPSRYETFLHLYQAFLCQSALGGMVYPTVNMERASRRNFLRSIDIRLGFFNVKCFGGEVVVAVNCHKPWLFLL